MVMIILQYFLTCLLAGMATYALAETVTEESGPFHVFDRLRLWLVPESLRPIAIDFDYQEHGSIADIYNAYEPFIKELENELAGIVRLLEYDETFNNSFRGTLFNILDCKFCFGVWAAHFINPLLFLAFFGFTGVNFGSGLLLSFVAVAFQRLIISWSNKR